MPIVLMEGCRVMPDSTGEVIPMQSSWPPTVWSRVASRTGWGFQQTSSSPNDASSGRANLVLTPRTPFTGTDFSIGFAMQHPSPAVTPSIPAILEIRSQNDAVTVGVDLSVMNGITWNTATGMSAPQVLDATPVSGGWHWWCMTGRMGTASGGWYRLYRDGNLIWRIEGDTLPTSSTGTLFKSAVIRIPHMNSISGCIVSDMILRNDTNVIPESRVDVLLPRANASVAWTPSAGQNWDCVNDEPTISTADFVSSSTVGATDLYNFEPLPYTPTAIQGAMLSVRASKSDAGTRTVAPVLNGTEGTALDPSTAGLTFTQPADTNPSGGAAWTKATIDAIQAGVRVKT